MGHVVSITARATPSWYPLNIVKTRTATHLKIGQMKIYGCPIFKWVAVTWLRTPVIGPTTKGIHTYWPMNCHRTPNTVIGQFLHTVEERVLMGVWLCTWSAWCDRGGVTVVMAILDYFTVPLHSPYGRQSICLPWGLRAREPPSQDRVTV